MNTIDNLKPWNVSKNKNIHYKEREREKIKIKLKIKGPSFIHDSLKLIHRESQKEDITLKEGI